MTRSPCAKIFFISHRAPLSYTKYAKIIFAGEALRDFHERLCDVLALCPSCWCLFCFS